ncbi:valyl-tRNA synthetase 2 [Salpingoeca rosetta]|uniref:Valine--tRNA ligase, mitochondrial n=1 Tax=Salpingoeca rosetta (strain ATCC 50818 / BSB-021) TaxID=946362 RepID=F2U3X4_SALR5|nr:valyl-tRNA synthetase 2 [Salpingoeca rosetta]EGD82318.1 valyl-tRNA synthetase 2 [Salpingoeca rosetta]|eukprot:XP_004996501.1 valyl-tRNA synthetase 2 [Salpingoeca rosetta]
MAQRVTVFGMTSAEKPSEDVQTKLAVLYPKQELSAKEKKKIQKMEKFLKKQQQKEQQAAVAGSDSKKKDKKKKKKKAEDTFVYKPVQPGEKKNLDDMPSQYHPDMVQRDWYEWWTKQGFFKPEYNEGHEKIACPCEKKSYTLVIPPPNVTGSLHMGHALTNSIEDTLTRWNRQCGKRTLWNPGCDHAGIATQSVVEKKLWREKQLRRQDLGREKFLDLVWQWKEEKGGFIYKQIKYLGASCDWDREAFTMSDRCCRAVKEAFIRMHEDGIIMRKKKLINWSCHLNSAISEIEVDKVDIAGRTLVSVPGLDEKVEVGVITSFAYKLKGGDDEIVVATTRPETMLGDVAIAVHPEDPRYASYVGKTALHPFIPDRELVIVADDFVDREFGTGAVKITPAHDPNDFECGVRNNLPMITVITKDGKIAPGCGEFSGMHRFTARRVVIERLKEKGLYRGDAENPMVIPRCSRSSDICEPLLETQWFVNCDGMAKTAVDAVKSGELRLIPANQEKTWFHWLESPRDWCISRQLWWGHRIPAYFVSVNDDAVPKGTSDDNKYWVSGHDEDEARAKAAKRFGVDPSKITLTQDEDVLDTWFSSGIFPISIFGWPDNTPDLQKFYPGDLLETGYDILFFWVARMVMMCTYLTGKLPFKDVYLHPIIRDKEGVKMSKSRGNVIDPTDVCTGITLEGLHERLAQGNLDPREIERAKELQKRQFPQGIKECGVDALRFTLCALVTPGRDINLDVNRIFGYRTFCNKVYNGVKLVMSKLGPDFKPAEYGKLLGDESELDLWMLSRLSTCIRDMNKQLEEYDLVGSTTSIYNLWLYEFCNFYLEVVKPVFQDDQYKHRRNTVQNVMYTVAESGLRLLSIFMPFLCEELWQRLPRRKATNDLVVPASVCVAAYPYTPLHINEDIEKKIAILHAIVGRARSLKSSLHAPSARPKLLIRGTTAATTAVCEEYAVDVAQLVRADVAILPAKEAPPADFEPSPEQDEFEVFMARK